MIYNYIVIIQIIDIILNFFKETKDNNGIIKDPILIIKTYLKSYFIFDCIAVFPYPMFYPKYSALRFLKLVKVGEYQNYFNNFLTDFLINFVKKQRISNVKAAFKMLLMLIFTSHIFAVLLVLIGEYEFRTNKDGWIQTGFIADP